jgi:hypothetical protein
MGTLRIKWEISYNEVIPTEYELQGNAENTTKDVYYNIGSERLNMTYPNRPTMLGNQPFTVWCARKLDFSGMANNETKTVLGQRSEGKITNFKNNSINMKPYALQSVTWSDHMITRVYYQQHFRALTENSTRQKLPLYLLVNNLAQLRENVFFYFIWSDNSTENTKYLSATSKYLELTLNLFYSNDTDEEI